MISKVVEPEGTERSVPLGAVCNDDVAWVGGKAANLGEMIRADMPVPMGFVVTTAAYKQFMAKHCLNEIVEELLDNIDVNDNNVLTRVASEIQELILSRSIPISISRLIKNDYKSLPESLVAVRSSATAEDLDDASFAGQQRTLLNVEGVENIVSAVKMCWASLFEARAIFYREENLIGHADVAIAVAVQCMVPAEVSGVMFTVDPSDGNRETMLIEGIYGLGEPLVSGELSPDAYIVERSGLTITNRKAAVQPWKLCGNTGVDGLEEGSSRVPVAPNAQGLQKLNDAQITSLAELGLRLEAHYGRPQDVEWAFADGNLYVLQSRSITTSGYTMDPESNGIKNARQIASGSGASPGVAAGVVRIIHSAADIDQVREGDIMVTAMTTPDFVPAMKRAAALVTDRGGRTCHAAIVSREMGLPSVVGAGDATVVLSEFLDVTVDGGTGAVFEGNVVDLLATEGEPFLVAPTMPTRTKLYVNLADPDAASRIASKYVDGVGLLRAEFMIAHLGEHPRSMIESGRGAALTDHLADGLERFASAFASRPVVYRFSDFKTNEYRNLKGGEDCEPYEENPMIGYRGCARYLAEPDLFALEVEAIMRARRRFSNLWAMVPFVRTPSELTEVISLLRKQGLEQSPDFKLWMMVEVPSNIILLDQFLDTGVDGVSIGSNDLTQLVLGVDRDNERMASMFDECDAAVLQAIEHVVTRCAERGVSVSICGQAPSVYPEITRKLVEWGVTSVSVTPDMIEKTRLTLHDAETAADAARAAKGNGVGAKLG